MGIFKYRSRCAKGARIAASVALAASLTAAGAPAAALAATTPQSAETQSVKAQEATSEGLKDNLSWELSGGVLTIRGTGEMSITGDYAPWLAGEDEGGYSLKKTTNINKVVIADGVTSIAYEAFSSCSNLKSVEIPASVTVIGYNAFKDCIGLESIIIPDTVSNLGSGLFYGCEGLVQVTLPAGLTALPRDLFNGCKSLEDIQLPAGLESIGMSSFASSGLRSIEFSETLKTISSDAFSKCEGLTSVSFPASVESVGARAFLKCTNLATVTYAGTPTVGQGAFTGTAYENNMGDFAVQNGVLTKYSGSDAAEVRIPEGVTKIAASAFGSSSNKHPEIEKVVIPAEVTEIGAFAFDYCSGLKTVVMEGTTAPKLGYGAFNGASSELQIIIPEGSTGYGNTGDTSNFWTTYADQTGTEADLKKRAEEREAAKVEAASISEAVKNLPELIDITADDKDELIALKNRFDKLSDEGKKQVSSTLQERLTNSYNQLQKILNATVAKGDVEIATSFSDPALQKILLRNYDKDRNGYLNADERGVATLDLSGGWKDPNTGETALVESLAGIEVFENLGTLDASSNVIESVDLSSLSELTNVDLSGNKLSALDVTGLAWLEKLDASDNKITSLDLSKNEMLTSLDVSDNKLRSLDASAAWSLTSLDASENRLESVDLSKNELLQSVDLSDNRLASLDVSQNEQLASLSAPGNELASVKLGNGVLSTVDLRENKLVSVDLSGLASLDTLRLSYNQLTSLDVSKNTQLYELAVSKNALTSLDLSANTNLSKSKFAAAGMSAMVKHSGASVDLKKVDFAMDASRVSNVEGAVLNGSTLSGFTGKYVDYTYDCGNGVSMSVSVLLSKQPNATPAKTSVTVGKVTGVKAKNNKKKTATISWKKNSSVSGYEIYRSAKKSSGFKKVKTIAKASTASWKNSKLKKDKTYYYKVRAYKLVGGKKVYGSYSKTAKVKVKK